MRNRIIAFVLALGMILSLAGCGSSSSADSSAASSSGSSTTVTKTYTSETAMDVFETIEAVQALEDFTFTLQVNSLDEETGEAVSTTMTLDGAWYASAKQASLTVTMANGETLTTLLVDGDQLYVDVVTASSYLSERFKDTDEEDSEYFVEELADLAESFPTDYILIQLQEDPWATLDGDSFAAVKELLENVYKSIKKATADEVSTSSSTCTLSLGLGTLQTQLLEVYESLVEDKSTYQTFLSDYIEQNFSALLDASGWTMADLMDTIWYDYEETYEDLTELESYGDWNDWTMKLVTCGDEDSGYTLDLTDCRDDSVNYCLNVYPVDSDADLSIGMPSESTEYTDIAEDVFTVFMDAIICRNYLEGFDDEEDGEDYDDEEDYEDYFDDDEEETEVSDELETTAIEGYDRLVATEMVTDDGVTVTIPVMKKYNTVEVESGSNGVVDIFMYTANYQMEYSNIVTDGRDIEEITQENLEIFASTFEDDYEYTLTQAASAVVSAEDGTACVGGLAYYDEDEECDVTILTGNIVVEDSDYVIGFDLFIYNDSLSNKEYNSITDFLTYLGLEAPVTYGN
ncbi:MAG: hypothetical protein LUD78_03695 [Clostridiales bacterium]|nr:hypothetical protein [Clostridiales bacterium]